MIGEKTNESFKLLAKKMSTEEWKEIENAQCKDNANDRDNEGVI